MVLVTVGVYHASLLTFIVPPDISVVLIAAPLDTWTTAEPASPPLTSVRLMMPPELIRALPLAPMVTSMARPLAAPSERVKLSWPPEWTSVPRTVPLLRISKLEQYTVPPETRPPPSA